MCKLTTASKGYHRKMTLDSERFLKQGIKMPYLNIKKKTDHLNYFLIKREDIFLP